MKTKLLFLALASLAGSQLSAQTVNTLPLYEPFNYTVGDKLITAAANTGLGNWYLPYTAAGGTSSDPLITATPTWSLPTNLTAATGQALQLVGGSDDPVLYIPNQGSTGTIYSSFVFRVTDQTATSTGTSNAGFFYSFGKVASSNTAFNYVSAVYINKTGTGTTFNLGIAETNSTGVITYSSASYNVNTDYFVVISYDIANSTSYMWINPVTNGTQPVETVNTSTDTSTSQRTDIVVVRISKESNAKTPNITLDEVRVGNTWASVTPTGPLATSESSIKSQSSLSIYPNPAKEYFVVESKNNTPIKSVAIYSAEGKLVKQIENPKSKQIDISGLSKGVYFVKIADEKSEVSQKLIVD